MSIASSTRHLHLRSMNHNTVFALICVALLGVTTAATAQPVLERQAPKPQPELGIDIEALLTSKLVLPGDLRGQVWQVSPNPGRRLVVLPLTIEPQEQETEIGIPTLKLRAGRFLAWYIVADDQQDSDAVRKRGAAPESTFRAGDSRYAKGFDPFSPAEAPLVRERDRMAVEKYIDSDQPRPDGPRFTREITVLPSDEIRWELDHVIPGGEVQQGESLYMLKLRQDRLRDLQPDRPERVTRNANESAREFLVRRRNLEAEFRAKTQQFQETRRQLGQLPETFTEPMPQHVWAVYEISTNIQDLEFSGPNLQPWTIGASELEHLRQIAHTGRGKDQFLDFATVNRLMFMMRDNHPYAHRTAALMLAYTGTTSQAQPGDVLFNMMQSIIAGPDDKARSIVLKNLASLVPPTRASVMLLSGAADRMDPATKLLSLRSMLQTDTSDPAKLRDMLASTNRLLSDPNGPSPADILTEVSASIGKDTNALAMATNGINLQRLPGERRDQAIAWVIRSAGENPLAANWLNHQLIGAADVELMKRTLELIASANAGPSTVAPVAGGLMDIVFGKSEASAAAAAAQLDTTLTGPLPIDSTSHSLFRVLSSGNPQIRELGWQALAVFEFVQADRRAQQPTQQQQSDTSVTDRYDLLMEAALAHKQTPGTLTAFLVKQPNEKRATESLVKVVVQGDEQAAAQAARALLRSKRTIGRALHPLGPDQRMAFTQRVYETLRGQVPVAAGLVRDNSPNSPVAVWFGKQLAEGQVPAAGDWATIYQNEDNLLNLAGSIDQDLARSAVAALVASAGGDQQTADELATRFANHTDRTVDGLRPIWLEAKRSIFTQRISGASGDYRLIVKVAGMANTPFPVAPGLGPSQGPAASSQQPLEVVLGVVNLVADESSVRLGVNQTLGLSVSDQRLALRVDQPNELKNFENEQIAELPLEHAQAVELLPQPDGSWQGETQLMDMRTLQIRLERAE